MKSFPLPFWRSTEVRVDQLKKSAELTNSVTATAAVKKKQESALEQQRWAKLNTRPKSGGHLKSTMGHGNVTPTWKSIFFHQRSNRKETFLYLSRLWNLRKAFLVNKQFLELSNLNPYLWFQIGKNHSKFQKVLILSNLSVKIFEKARTHRVTQCFKFYCPLRDCNSSVVTDNEAHHSYFCL